jgi:two-component system, OmpR family, phosphate regulon sensor histidine kinase PhoR
MFKNVTPRQIAFWVATLITLLLMLMLWVINKASRIEINSFLLFNLLIIFAFICYFIVFGFIDAFIYRKVKLIYKTIHSYKSKPEQQFRSDISEGIFEDVENEVMRWVVDSERKISDLTALEEYRRNFVGNVSHELKTPIFNIQGFLETLLDGGLEDPILTEKYLTRAAKNAERLQIIVDDLLMIGRLESGTIALEVEEFNLRDFLEDVLEDMEMSAKERNITLSFKDRTLPNFIVRADIENMRKVFINLIANSIKYGNQNGHTKIGIYDMEQRILVEVSDDGIGIVPEHLTHLFDRFYRADKARSRNEGGSGLGLAIVKHIVEAHGQTIHVRSSLGVGTTFALTVEKA